MIRSLSMRTLAASCPPTTSLPSGFQALLSVAQTVQHCKPTMKAVVCGRVRPILLERHSTRTVVVSTRCVGTTRVSLFGSSKGRTSHPISPRRHPFLRLGVHPSRSSLQAAAIHSNSSKTTVPSSTLPYVAIGPGPHGRGLVFQVKNRAARSERASRPANSLYDRMARHSPKHIGKSRVCTSIKASNRTLTGSLCCTRSQCIHTSHGTQRSHGISTIENIDIILMAWRNTRSPISYICKICSLIQGLLHGGYYVRWS